MSATSFAFIALLAIAAPAAAVNVRNATANVTKVESVIKANIAVKSVRSAVNGTQLPMTEIVRVDATEVMGQSSGFKQLGKCRFFSDAAQKNPDTPVVEVCGTKTKVTVFLRGRCKDYSQYTKEIGQCNTKMDSSGCVSAGPKTDPWIKHARSYSIEMC